MLPQGFRSGGIRCASGRLVAVFLGLGAALAALGSRAAWAVSPEQAVVFDGSSSVEDTFLVSLSSSGLLVDGGAGGFECPGVAHVSQGGVLTIGPSETGVFAPLLVVVSESQTALLTQPNLASAAIEAFGDDCDVEGGFSAAGAYVAQARSEAESTAATVESCTAQVEQAYCSLVAAIEQATIVPEPPGLLLLLCGASGSDDTAEFPDSMNALCTRYVEYLRNWIPYSLDGLALQLARCQDILSTLLATTPTIGPWLSQQQHDDLLSGADADLAAAHMAMEVTQAELDAFYSLQAEMTLEAVQQSCSGCSPSGDVSFHFLPSVALSLQAGAGPLPALVSAFQAAARDADDPNDATRWNAVASRMSSIPASRVLHVTHPTASQVGMHIVALRGESPPDDEISPLAVIVTAEAGSPWAPQVNTMDRHIVTEVWRALAHTRDPNAVLPDDEDDDDDGLRDIYETDTGRYVSPLETGTSPILRDTDGSLFWDGTEVAAGSDPTDPNSEPERAALLSIPALAAWGLIALSILALGGALASHIMVRHASPYRRLSKANY